MDKFISRKFVLALLSAISGIAISLTELDGKVGVICAVISAIIPAVTYIVTEGTIDAKAIELSVNAVKEAEKIIEEGESDGKSESNN